MKDTRSEDYLDGYSHGFAAARASLKDLSVPSLWIGVGIGICLGIIVVGFVAARG
jgi:hypothetical protein